MEVYVGQFLIFLMLFARVTAMIVVAPVLGHLSVPVQVKVAIGLFLAFVMFPIARETAPVLTAELVPLVLMILKEVAVGLIIGFAAGLIFAGVRFAGELISMDMGIAMAQMFDPETNRQSSVISEAMYIMLLLVFLLMNGHHFVLEAMQLSFAAVPIGDVSFTAPASAMMIKMTGLTFVIAVKLAAPVIVSMFLINLALSILARVMPQMNIFAVAFPLKIGVGLFALMAAVPLLVFVFKKMLTDFQGNLMQLVKLL